MPGSQSALRQEARRPAAVRPRASRRHRHERAEEEQHLRRAARGRARQDTRAHEPGCTPIRYYTINAIAAPLSAASVSECRLGKVATRGRRAGQGKDDMERHTHTYGRCVCGRARTTWSSTRRTRSCGARSSASWRRRSAARWSRPPPRPPCARLAASTDARDGHAPPAPARPRVRLCSPKGAHAPARTRGGAGRAASEVGGPRLK